MFKVLIYSIQELLCRDSHWVEARLCLLWEEAPRHCAAVLGIHRSLGEGEGVVVRWVMCEVGVVLP